MYHHHSRRNNQQKDASFGRGGQETNERDDSIDWHQQQQQQMDQPIGNFSSELPVLTGSGGQTVSGYHSVIDRPSLSSERVTSTRLSSGSRGGFSSGNERDGDYAWRRSSMEHNRSGTSSSLASSISSNDTLNGGVSIDLLENFERMKVDDETELRIKGNKHLRLAERHRRGGKNSMLVVDGREMNEDLDLTTPIPGGWNKHGQLLHFAETSERNDLDDDPPVFHHEKTTPSSPRATPLNQKLYHSSGPLAHTRQLSSDSLHSLEQKSPHSSGSVTPRHHGAQYSQNNLVHHTYLPQHGMPHPDCVQHNSQYSSPAPSPFSTPPHSPSVMHHGGSPIRKHNMQPHQQQFVGGSTGGFAPIMSASHQQQQQIHAQMLHGSDMPFSNFPSHHQHPQQPNFAFPSPFSTHIYGGSSNSSSNSSVPSSPHQLNAAPFNNFPSSSSPHPSSPLHPTQQHPSTHAPNYNLSNSSSFLFQNLFMPSDQPQQHQQSNNAGNIAQQSTFNIGASDTHNFIPQQQAETHVYTSTQDQSQQAAPSSGTTTKSPILSPTHARLRKKRLFSGIPDGHSSASNAQNAPSRGHKPLKTMAPLHINLPKPKTSITSSGTYHTPSIRIRSTGITGMFSYGNFETESGVLGRGASSVVIRAVYRDPHSPYDGYKYAIKIVDLKAVKASVIENEIQSIMNMKSEFVVRLYDAFSREGSIHMVLEYMELGSLEDVCKVLPQRRIPDDVLRELAGQLMQGLAYLEEKHIVHRDIKPANCLLNKKGRCKLGDFGFSRRKKEEKDVLQTYQGSMTYMSPERIQGKEHGYNSDVWSLGVTILECALGRYPFHEKGQPISEGLNWWQAQNLIEQGLNIESSEVSPDLEDFVRQCTVVDPDARPNASELVNHQYLVLNSTSATRKW
eukprot:CAMPEP_0117441528 /NCGR_PEP_ID=MMETSP0759-20121206/3681_1 /TAXON_ID=63605 /ORGANISM="Percolomonas cosmopolitus, Strain WS" /LENGTH=899 /DNA_ID=CAMNT_0005233385 /DNA_START=244 /DNA_END=2940 /DNA_ORIENTATION=+